MLRVAVTDVVDHRVGLDAAGGHIDEALEDALSGLTPVIADEHVGHQMLGRDAGIRKPVDTLTA
jgi:hypothetical protein